MTMRMKMGMTVALLSLGLLLHRVRSDDPQPSNPSPVDPADPPAPPPATTTVLVPPPATTTVLVPALPNVPASSASSAPSTPTKPSSAPPPPPTVLPPVPSATSPPSLAPPDAPTNAPANTPALPNSAPTSGVAVVTTGKGVVMVTDKPAIPPGGSLPSPKPSDPPSPGPIATKVSSVPPQNPGLLPKADNPTTTPVSGGTSGPPAGPDVVGSAVPSVTGTPSKTNAIADNSVTDAPGTIADGSLASPKPTNIPSPGLVTTKVSSGPPQNPGLVPKADKPATTPVSGGISGPPVGPDVVGSAVPSVTPNGTPSKTNVIVVTDAPGTIADGSLASPKPTNIPSPSLVTPKVSSGPPQNPGLVPKADKPATTPVSGGISGRPVGPDAVGPAATSVTPNGTPPKPKATADNKVTVAPGAIATSITKSMNTGLKTKTFSFPLNKKPVEEDQDLVDLCQKLMSGQPYGSCTLRWSQEGEDINFDSVDINSNVKGTLADQYFGDIRKGKSPPKPGDKTTLIAILASCGALLAMIIGLGIYATHHRKPYHENQQHLTEELHTVENGYHDNPTLEVMEVQPEMQEKKTPLCNDFNDSWIVPMETMAKEVLPDEEDTHL